MEDNKALNSAWFIVGFSFITLALVYSVWYSFSVFFVALLKEFGWSRSTGAGAFSLFIILSSMTGPFVGGKVDQFGPKKVIIIGSLILGTGLALCSLIQTWWQFYIFFSVITAMGLGATGWVPNITIIQQWFKEKRGLPTGIVSSGIGIGILFCVPSIQYLIIKLGWRTTYGIMAIFIPLIVISMAIPFLKRPPKTTSVVYIENEISPVAVMKDPLVVNEEWASRFWTARQAIGTKPFRLLSLSLFLGNFTTQSIFAHQVAFFVDRGLEALSASYIVGIVGIVSIGSKILWGVLSDKIGREVTYTIGMACSISGIIFLIIFGITPYASLPYFYAFLFGMGYAVTAALPPLITADFFEGKGYGGIFGTLMVFVNLGGASGIWFAGFIYDQVGSYLPVFIILIASLFVSNLSIWWAAPRKIRRVPGKSKKLA
jgi:MFS family permease